METTPESKISASKSEEKTEVYLNKGEASAPRVSKAKKAPNMEPMYRVVGELARIEKDVKPVPMVLARLQDLRNRAETELHLLQTHINRVARELDILRSEEMSAHRDLSHRLSKVASHLSSLKEDLADELADDELAPLLDELEASAERSLSKIESLRRPLEAVARFQAALSNLKSLQSLSLPPVQDLSEVRVSMETAKSAHLERLVKWESKLAKRYDSNSRTL